METEDKNLKRIMGVAAGFERAGELERALDLYSQALDLLVEQARFFAEKSETVDAIVGKGVLSPQYLMKFNAYLKRDYLAAILSNGMGNVFAKIGDKASAKAFYEQAIDLTPSGEVYDEPHIGLEMLKNL